MEVDQIAQLVFTAIAQGNWALVAVGGVYLITWVITRYAKILNAKAVTVLAVVLSVSFALINAVAAQGMAGLTATVVIKAVLNGLGAAGVAFFAQRKADPPALPSDKEAAEKVAGL